jgi:hypothetical protein
MPVARNGPCDDNTPTSSMIALHEGVEGWSSDIKGSIFNRPTINPFPPVLTIAHRVQFIHQTVKEYVQGRKDNLGLKRSRSGGSGSQYVLTAAVYYKEEWADDIGSDLFEYARIVNFDKTIEAQSELHNSLDTLQQPRIERSLFRRVGNRVDWWLERIHTNFYKSLFGSVEEVPTKLQCLALAAGLFEYVEASLGKYVSPMSTSLICGLLYTATIGPKINSVQASRREMLSLLFKHGILVDEVIYTISPEIPSSNSPLTLIIETKGKFEQDEKERVSAIACLLDHGADPNMIFLQCIQRESVEVVRLFGQYGATLPRDMILPALALWGMVSRGKFPSDVLREVIRIMQRSYPEVEFEDRSIWGECYMNREVPVPVLLPVSVAIIAMICGLGPVFGLEDSISAANRVRTMPQAQWPHPMAPPSTTN